jgi:hypothetical protein
MMTAYHGPPTTLGNAAAARVRLTVRCLDCRDQVEPDPAEMADGRALRRRDCDAGLAPSQSRLGHCAIWLGSISIIRRSPMTKILGDAAVAVIVVEFGLIVVSGRDDTEVGGGGCSP